MSALNTLLFSLRARSPCCCLCQERNRHFSPTYAKTWRVTQSIWVVPALPTAKLRPHYKEATSAIPHNRKVR
jgi:hypothetical protein